MENSKSKELMSYFTKPNISTSLPPLLGLKLRIFEKSYGRPSFPIKWFSLLGKSCTTPFQSDLS
jgi:hypothetical protein